MDAKLEELNEGQKMVFDMQDAMMNKHQITNANIVQPQLLEGYDLDEAKIKSKLQQSKILDEIMDDKEQQEKIDKEKTKSLYLERETDNLYALIYKINEEDEGMKLAQAAAEQQRLAQSLHRQTLDSTRYDTDAVQLTKFRKTGYKKLLKRKFVTGQTRDKVMQNLMNESDSDEEGRDRAGNKVDKDQLRRMEANEVK